MDFQVDVINWYAFAVLAASAIVLIYLWMFANISKKNKQIFSAIVLVVLAGIYLTNFLTTDCPYCGGTTCKINGLNSTFPCACTSTGYYCDHGSVQHSSQCRDYWDYRGWDVAQKCKDAYIPGDGGGGGGSDDDEPTDEELDQAAAKKARDTWVAAQKSNCLATRGQVYDPSKYNCDGFPTFDNYVSPKQRHGYIFPQYNVNTGCCIGVVKDKSGNPLPNQSTGIDLTGRKRIPNGDGTEIVCLDSTHLCTAAIITGSVLSSTITCDNSDMTYCANGCNMGTAACSTTPLPPQPTTTIDPIWIIIALLAIIALGVLFMRKKTYIIRRFRRRR